MGRIRPTASQRVNLKTVTRGFLGLVMTVLKSVFKNSKWRIQYRDLAYNISVNSEFFCCNWFKNYYSGVSGVEKKIRAKLSTFHQTNMHLTAILDSPFFILKFVISNLKNLKNPRVIVSKRIRAKLSKFHQRIIFLAAILDPPFWILRFWLQTRNQRF